MDVQAGVHVTVVGMALVFSALAVLMLAIMILNRVFGPREEIAPRSPSSREGQDEETAIAAAIAVALSLALEEEAETYPPQPIHVLSVHREIGAWKAHSRLGSTE